MPIVYLPPVPPPPPPKTWPRVEAPAAKRLVWIAPDGTRLDLTSDPYRSLTGRGGFGLPEQEITTDRFGNGEGLLRDIRVAPRVLTVPLLVIGTDQERYLRAHRSLQQAFRHRTSSGIRPGRLRVELPDGSAREISCYYQGGLDAAEEELDDLSACAQAYPNLEFHAPDPYFEGPEQVVSWRVENDPRAFYPVYPITLGTSQVGEVATITNPGDAPAHPVWELVGPGRPVVTNTETGAEWAFERTLEPGQRVTVDCRPVASAPDSGLTAVDGDGEDWWPHLAEWPHLFPLESGGNRLRVRLADATTESTVRVAFRPRYQAGW